MNRETKVLRNGTKVPLASRFVPPVPDAHLEALLGKIDRAEAISAFSAFDEDEYTARSWAEADPYNTRLAYRILTYGIAAVVLIGAVIVVAFK